MVDHYQVLGISPSASQDDIKSAFKKLAVKYHPDKNPGNPIAEELFKETNRAYQILSDPYKRHQYDIALKYGRRPPPPPTRSAHRPFYYPPFSRQGQPSAGYEYGWKYVKAQVAAFAFVFVIAALVMGVKYWYDGYIEAKEARLAEVREQMFAEAQAYFDQGEYEKSLDIIIGMYQKNPLERSIADYREKFITALLVQGDSQFVKNNFESAIISFTLVKDYQRIQDPKVYDKLAESYLALEQYEQAAGILGLRLQEDRDNLKLNLEVGSIYLDRLQDPDRAKPYLDQARRRVKDILTHVYGQAPEMIMKPDEAPPIYFQVYFTRARLNHILELHEDAIKDSNWSIFLRPDLSEPYHIRGVAYHALGNNFRACKNWFEASRLGHIEANQLRLQYCN